MSDIENKLGKGQLRPVKVQFVKADAPTKPKNVANQMDDPFKDLVETEGVIEPPYDPETFLRMPEQNNILQSLIDAYKTNIPGFGYNFRYTIDMESPDIDEGLKERAKKEWVFLDLFYGNCNFDKTFAEINKMMIDDREKIGWGTIEVIPAGNGKPGGFEYIPAHTIRLTKLHPDIQNIPIMAIGMDGKKMTITYAKKFRRFVQVKDNEKVWFKEFGDPRKMSWRTGKFEKEYVVQNGEVREVVNEILPEDEATSIMYFPISVAYSPYGVPRWIGNILSLTGSRKSEELNYAYFTRGKHIPMAVIVRNGSLTESSIEELKSYSNQLEGVENAFGYLILEAEGFGSSDGFEEGQSQVDIKLQPLTQAMQHDALFQEYDDKNRGKVRAAFRLPPIYTGESKDYTRATADTARSIAEEQIFHPERQELAHKYNKLINSALGIRYCEMYFRGPDLSNKLELAQAIDIYNKAGAVTPNMLIGAVSDLLGEDFEYIQEDWANLPLQLAISMMSGKTKVDSKGKKDSTTATESTEDPSFTDDSAKTDPVGE